MLVVGADGMLGSRLVSTCEQQGTSVWGTTRRPAEVHGRRVYLDLADDMNRFVPPFSGAGAAVLCAAHTSIAQCERDPRATRRINVDNTVALARSLLDAGMFVVLLSSNTVFDGLTAFPRCDGQRNPQHEYGRQKADAESQVLALGEDTAVIRFGKIIAPDMPLLAGWVGHLRAGEPIRPFSDAVMAPVSAAFATEVICRVDEYRRAGVTQASASEDISYAGAAHYLAARVAADAGLVQPVSWKGANVPAFPEHTTLDSTALAELSLQAPPPTHALDQFH